MKSKLISDGPQKTFVIVFDTGDEVIEQLESFASENKLTASHFTAIGAFSEAKIAFFDFSIKDYKPIEVNEQVEVLILSGNISLHENKPKIHCHVVLGKFDGLTVGGHLLSAHVKPTLEVFLSQYPSSLQRVKDVATG